MWMMRGGRTFPGMFRLGRVVRPVLVVVPLSLRHLSRDLIRVDEPAGARQRSVDFLEGLSLVAVREVVERERRHHEIKARGSPGQRLACVVHNAELETSRL